MSDNNRRDTLSLDKTTRSESPRDQKGRDEEVRFSEKKARRKRSEEGTELDIPKELIPPGVAVEWKRVEIYGKPDDTHLMGLEQDGWEPVPTDKFRALVGKNYKGNTIRRGDLELWWRPLELSIEARAEDKKRAVQQVRDKMRELHQVGDGEAPRDNKGKSMVSVSTSYEGRLPVEN